MKLSHQELTQIGREEVDALLSFPSLQKLHYLIDCVFMNESVGEIVRGSPELRTRWAAGFGIEQWNNNTAQKFVFAAWTRELPIATETLDRVLQEVSRRGAVDSLLQDVARNWGVCE